MQCRTFIVALIVAVVGKGSCMNDDYSVDADIGRKIDSGWTWNTNEYPNPRTDFTKCHQSKPSTICDPDSLLTISESSQLSDLMQRLSNASPCLCKDDCVENAHNKGLVVGVALMKKFFYPYHEDKILGAKKMSQDIMKRWNFGTCNNDILIFISEENNVANIETGDAVKEFISEETLEEIFEQCKDYFQSNNFYTGLESIINSLYDSIQTKMLKAAAGNAETDTKKGNIGLTVGLVVGIACLAGFVVVGFLVIRRRQKRASNQHRFMYDESSGRPGRNIKRDMIGPIVKTPVVFPDAVYQPCSIDDGKKATNTVHQAGSDDEDDLDNSEDNYLKRLEENPAYMSTDISRELSVVEEGTEPKTPPVVVVEYPNGTEKQPSSHHNKINDGYA